jgi:hypothetical protein
VIYWNIERVVWVIGIGRLAFVWIKGEEPRIVWMNWV